MAFKRALWTSGYTYQLTCPYCGELFAYTDRELDYRAWYPNGFIYCHRCRRPLRHNEIYAVYPDGSRVYQTAAEAQQAINTGYYSAFGVNAPPVRPMRTQQPTESYCQQCGRRYVNGRDHFCSGCGQKLD